MWVIVVLIGCMVVAAVLSQLLLGIAARHFDEQDRW